MIRVLVLVVAGTVAGAVGSAGGITSLVSYPALLAVGIPAVAADVANIVALVACWPGSALASTAELAGRGGWVLRWGALTAVGGAAGAALLVSTPPSVFAGVVPVLLVGASVALLAQPRITAWRDARNGGGRPLLLGGGVAGLSVYNGYFGAGAGVMLLALLLVTVDRRLPAANALKNMLVGAGCVVSAATLVVLAPVRWGAVAPLAVGLFAGATRGPVIARRVPEALLRRTVALFGIGLAAWLTLG